jgi:hypothetical protein
LLPKLLLNIPRSGAGLFNIDTSAMTTVTRQILFAAASPFSAMLISVTSVWILESPQVSACLSFRVTFTLEASGSLRLTAIEANHSVLNKFR